MLLSIVIGVGLIGLLNFGYCYEPQWTTVASSDYNCIHKRNITFFGSRSFYTVNEEIQNTLGICFNVNVFQPSIRKTVNSYKFMVGTEKNYKSEKSEYGSIFSINTKFLRYRNTNLGQDRILYGLQMLSDGIDTTHVSDGDTKQTLVYFSLFSRRRSKLIFNELQRMREKGWDIVVICNFNLYQRCPIKKWIPVHLILPMHGVFNFKSDAYRHTDFSSLIHVLRNPSFDRTDWLMKIELEATKSCFTDRRIVLHIIIGTQFTPLIKYAIAVTSHLPRHQIHFRFYRYPIFFWLYRIRMIYDIKFFKFLIWRYGIDETMISFKNYENGFLSLDSIFSFMKENYENPDSTKRNMYLFTVENLFSRYLCRTLKETFSKSELKSIHLFTKRRRASLTLCHCQNPISTFYTDLQNEEDIFEMINKLACNSFKSHLKSL